LIAALAVVSCALTGVAVVFGMAESCTDVVVGRVPGATASVVPLGRLKVPPLGALIVCVIDSVAPEGVGTGVGLGIGPGF
jgi:hypothetical protein